MKKSVAFTIFGIMAAIIIGVGVYAWTLDSNLNGERSVTSAYSSGAVSQFTGAVAEFDEALRESQYATNAALVSTLCAKAAANAAGAVTALSAMPYSTQELELLSQYLNGAGDYALYLSGQAAKGRMPTGEELENLAALSEAISNISTQTGGIFAALDAGDLTMDEYGAVGADGVTGTVGSELAALDAALDDFPELDYAGRYSAASMKPEAAYTAGLESVSEDEARVIAAQFLGVEPGQLEPTGRSEGVYAVYGFVQELENGARYITVTENGGVVATLSGSCSGATAGVSSEKAEETALALLGGLFTDSFVTVESVERAGLYDLTLAPEADGVLLLPDSIEVEIDAATGEICSYNAHNYIMYHTQRTNLAADIDAGAARAAVPSSLSIEGERLVLARSDGGVETLCWEFACKNAAGGGVNVFVDAKNAQQVKIELTN